MQLPMMTAAERDGELVADFKTQRSGLGKPQVMRIGWLPAADQAGLRSHESQMGFVAKTLGLGDGEKAVINLSRHEVRRRWGNGWGRRRLLVRRLLGLTTGNQYVYERGRIRMGRRQGAPRGAPTIP